ncbi:MAG TPA: ABC transporter substrate-binding protein [Candidatus Binataceae bacterium]|nr:ABC transporter substrate-binding protein [Candidatus Binataceae bacterium]
MRRRDFISLLSGAAAAWPLVARAQQPKLPVIGFLSPGSPEADANRMNSVRRGLTESGYVEGQNVAIEYRGAQNRYDHLPALADDLVKRQVSVIVAGSTPATLAAKAATSTLPIVFLMGGDPVEFNVVASLNRPDGNITGVYNLNTAVTGKRLELVHELVPAAGMIALLSNPSSPFTEAETKELHEAARALGVELRVLNATNESEIDTAFAILAKEQPVPLVVSADTFFTNQRVRLVILAARHAIPAIYAYRDFAAAGGLMSYGSDLDDAYRLAGTYAGRILKGAKPADLPVLQATKVELYINLPTAKAIGITVPLPLLARADEVIE